LVFSLVRLNEPLPSKSMNVALIQANIGSLEKVAARRGIYSKVRHVINTYERLTDEAVQSKPKPDLIIWPETAMPFQLENTTSPYVTEIRDHVLQWKATLITGAYAASPFDRTRDYNSAYMLEPIGGGQIRQDLYNKNILLAFGEYMPFGEWFPILYEKFPQ